MALLWERSAALQQVRAVRDCLVNGMWITEWLTVPPKAGDGDDAKPARAQVRVTVRGWRDAMGKVEAAWSAQHGGKPTTVSKLVEEALRKRAEFVADTVAIVAQKEVKECLAEFTIQMDLAAAPTAAPEGGKGKAGKRK